MAGQVSQENPPDRLHEGASATKGGATLSEITREFQVAYEQEIKDLKEQIAARDAETSHLRQEVHDVKAKCNAKDQTIHAMKGQLEARDKEVGSLADQFALQTEHMNNLRRMLAESQEAVKRLSIRPQVDDAQYPAMAQALDQIRILAGSMKMTEDVARDSMLKWMMYNLGRLSHEQTFSARRNSQLTNDMLFALAARCVFWLNHYGWNEPKE
jgi:predicted RNase H-like nuclease (RuvC/YqgF family)